MMWLLLNTYWLIAVLAGIVVVLAILPATALGTLSLLKDIRNEVWVGLVAAFLFSLGASWLVGYGAAQCEARWEAAQEATEAENARREAAAFKAGTEAAQKAAQAQADTRKQTDEAVEVVKIEWRERIVRLPAVCRVEQSDRMRDEGRKAVAAARDSL